MKRKTVKLARLVERVNYRNKLSKCSSEARAGWNSLLEDMLMEADVYAGFRPLNTSEVPNGHRAGDEDTSRVEYFLHSALK